MKKLFKSTIKVDGKEMHAVSGHAYKEDAQKIAKQLRKSKHCAHIVDRRGNGGGWVVYSRRKEQ
jgi:hypothetical protein